MSNAPKHIIDEMEANIIKAVRELDDATLLDIKWALETRNKKSAKKRKPLLRVLAIADQLKKVEAADWGTE